MEKRGLTIGTYNTKFYGWTLAALTLTDPEYKANFQEVPGRDGQLDLSTSLTDGVPRYGSRVLTATLENSEGTRADRRALIGKMVNDLDGLRFDIKHPDYPAHYLTGRVKIVEDYNDLAHAAVTITATCDPWLYSRTERVYTITAAKDKQTKVLSNRGRRVVFPTVQITGATDSSLVLEYGFTVEALGAGTFLLPGLLLPPGDTVLHYSGTGTARISYREAVLR